MYYTAVVRVDTDKEDEIDKLLNTGWEPFSASMIGMYEYIWFRLPAVVFLGKVK